MLKVRVTKDKEGNVITVSEKNPEYGHIRVEQECFQINDQGWLKSSTRSAIIHGKIEDLVKTGYKDGTEIPGKIVIIESLKPFNQEDPDKNLKIAGETGVICRVDDEPIYRQTFFTPNQNSFDELINHTNTDEIREVMEAQKMMKSIAQTRKEGAAKEAAL